MENIRPNLYLHSAPATATATDPIDPALSSTHPINAVMVTNLNIQSVRDNIIKGKKYDNEYTNESKCNVDNQIETRIENDHQNGNRNGNSNSNANGIGEDCHNMQTQAQVQTKGDEVNDKITRFLNKNLNMNINTIRSINNLNIKDGSNVTELNNNNEKSVKENGIRNGNGNGNKNDDEQRSNSKIIDYGGNIMKTKPALIPISVSVPVQVLGVGSGIELGRFKSTDPRATSYSHKSNLLPSATNSTCFSSSPIPSSSSSPVPSSMLSTCASSFDSSRSSYGSGNSNSNGSTESNRIFSSNRNNSSYNNSNRNNNHGDDNDRNKMTGNSNIKKKYSMRKSVPGAKGGRNASSVLSG